MRGFFVQWHTQTGCVQLLTCPSSMLLSTCSLLAVRSAVRDGYQNDVLEVISVLYGGFQFWLADPHFPVCVGFWTCAARFKPPLRVVTRFGRKIVSRLRRRILQCIYAHSSLSTPQTGNSKMVFISKTPSRFPHLMLLLNNVPIAHTVIFPSAHQQQHSPP